MDSPAACSCAKCNLATIYEPDYIINAQCFNACGNALQVAACRKRTGTERRSTMMIMKCNKTQKGSSAFPDFSANQHAPSCRQKNESHRNSCCLLSEHRHRTSTKDQSSSPDHPPFLRPRRSRSAMTEVDPHANADFRQFFIPPAHEKAAPSTSTESHAKQPDKESNDVQLDTKLSNLFDGLVPNESPPSPPSARQIEPGLANDSDVELGAELSKVFDKPAVTEVSPSPSPSVAPQQKRCLAHALRANSKRLSLSAAYKRKGAGDLLPASSVAPVTTKAKPKPINAEETEPATEDTTNATSEGDKEVRKPLNDGHKSEDVAPASARELMKRRLAAKNGASRNRHAPSNSSLMNGSNNASLPKPSEEQFLYHDKHTTRKSLKDARLGDTQARRRTVHSKEYQRGRATSMNRRMRSGCAASGTVDKPVWHSQHRVNSRTK
ncbi:hypothetical protein FGB62_294g02 [Gracilaria domingensis]|nr:hypothetical protein FGB62_294g02 [Gracilaria domingensis]